MNEAELYEQIGRLSVALGEKEKAVLDCCGVIHGLKTGTVNLDQLTTTETGFTLTPITTVSDLLKQDDAR